MKMRRNQETGSQAACPSCYYDEVFGTAQNTAAGASVTTSVEIEFDQFMCPQYVDTVVMSNANSQINDRHLITDVRIQSCSQLGSDSAAAATSAGIVIPDMLGASSDCCLGTPVCWGAFGKTALTQDVRISHTSLSTIATDTYFLIRGQAMSTLPLGWKLGKRCTRC